MRMKKQFLALFCALFIGTSILSSCNFKPDDTEPVDSEEEEDSESSSSSEGLSISISADSDTLAMGSRMAFTVTVSEPGHNYTVTSSKTSVATIDGNEIVGVNEGTTTIKASINENVFDSFKLTVMDPDDMWTPDEGEDDDGVDPNLPAKEGEVYESYSFKPSCDADSLIPNIVVTLNPLEEEGTAPIMEDTYLTTASKNNKGPYYGCTVSILEGEEQTMTDVACQIKVRGNYTANYRKKPYRLKFDKKQAMPGFKGKFKNWVLLADVKDHSMMRNAMSFYLGNLILGSDGFYSSNFRPINLYFIDGTGQQRYWGSYLLAAQQEVKDGRISITDVGDLGLADGNYNGTDIGYFIEYDGYYIEERGGSTNFSYNDSDFAFTIDDGSATGGDATFTIPYNNRASFRTLNNRSQRPNIPGFTLKGDVSEDDPSDQLNFISNYMENVYLILYHATYDNKFYKFNEDYTAIVEDNTLDAQSAIAGAIDIKSLVDTYIISEISCDPDVAWSSFLMDVDFGAEAANHLLRFEAPWDFDSCYAVRSGNYCTSGQGYYAATSSNPWLSIIMNHEWFRNMVKEKYRELYSFDILKDVLDWLDSITNAQQYKDMYAANFDKWGTGDETGEVRAELRNLQTEREHAEALYEWLRIRFNWMSSEWLDGYDIITHKKESSAGTTSEGNVALIERGTPYKYEAENAQTSNEEMKKLNRQDYPASNSGWVGNLNQSGLEITFTVTATKRKQAYIVACVAKPQGGAAFNDMFKLYINGERLSIRDVQVPACSSDQYHEWVEVRLNSQFLEVGENEIKFVSGSRANNFDYITVYSKDTLS